MNEGVEGVECNSMKTVIKWKVYFVLLGASVFSIIAVLPYAFTLAGEIIQQAPVPFSFLVIASILQSSILFAVVLFLGLLLAEKTGFGLPVLDAYILKKKIQVDIPSLLKTSVFLGVGVGIAIIVLDFLFRQVGVGINLFGGQMPPFWMGFLASFYGGISEEILLRLFFMSFVVWIFGFIVHSNESILKNNVVMWSSIIVASILFGLGHLPITASVTALTPLVISRAIVLNGVGGIVFGWLYWKKGFESAIVAHFSADIVLHVLFPFLLLTVGSII